MRAAVALLAVLALSAMASATTQDAATYPDGITSVHNSPVQAGQDFEVTAAADGADAVSVTVCRFRSAEAPTPDVCYMNLGAKPADGGWTASTSAVTHPAWRDGWVVGYKVTAERGGAESHAPDRTTSTGDQDYYRVVVGSPQDDPAPEGTAIVEDAPDAPAAASDADRDAPAPAGLLLALGCLALAARRR